MLTDGGHSDVFYCLKGGGARYPYPKEVWSPAGALDNSDGSHAICLYLSVVIGGWWTRPSNWKANTTILFAGILAVSYGVWTVSADKEVSSPAFCPDLGVLKLWTSSIATMNHSVPSLPCGYVHSSLFYVAHLVNLLSSLFFAQWAKQYRDSQGKKENDES